MTLFAKIFGALFKTVGFFYDILIKIANGEIYQFDSVFDDTITLLYTIIGIFMVFRLAVSLLQYLIDPEKVSDKQAGGGKLLIRIVIAIVLLLSLNSIIFPRLDDLQAAILESGILNQLFPAASAKGTNESSNDKKSLFVENVNAADKDLTCFYTYRPRIGEINDCDEKIKSITIKPIVISVSFKFTGDKTIPNGYSKIYSIDGLYAKYNGSEGNYRNVDLKINIWQRSWDTGWFLTKNYSENELATLISQGTCPGALEDTVSDCNFSSDVAKCGSMSFNIRKEITGTNSVFASWGFTYGRKNATDSVDAFRNDIKTLVSDKCDVAYTNDFNDSMDNAGISTDAVGEMKLKEEGYAFANNLANAFIEKYSICDDECQTKCSHFLDNDATMEEVGKLNNNNKITIHAFSGMLFAIGVLVFIILLCIDVIIRYLKLTFLKVLAPIATVSYMNPNDKIFSQWLKMYMSTYADLFIKLIAVNAATYFIGKLLSDVNMGGMYKILIIIAIFLFAKTLPSMISKVFGLDVSGGSFKDIAGFAKKGAGLAAGAAIGGVAGGLSGIGRGGTPGTVIGGALAGTVRGANSGRKGDLTGGATTQMARNRTVKDANLNGSSAGQRFAARFHDPTRKYDNDIAKLQEDLRAPEQKETVLDATASAISSMEQRAGDKIDEGKGANLAAVQYYHQKQSELANLGQAMSRDDYFKAHPYKQSAPLAAGMSGPTALTQDQMYQNYVDNEAAKRAALSSEVQKARDDAKHAYIDEALQNTGFDDNIVQSKESIQNMASVHGEAFANINTDFKSYSDVSQAKGDVGKAKAKTSNDVYRMKEEISRIEHERDRANVTKQAIGKGGGK